MDIKIKSRKCTKHVVNMKVYALMQEKLGEQWREDVILVVKEVTLQSRKNPAEAGRTKTIHCGGKEN